MFSYATRLMLSFGVYPFEFLGGSYTAKIRILGPSIGEDFVIIACVFLIQLNTSVGPYDRHTDRQTHGQTETDSWARTRGAQLTAGPPRVRSIKPARWENQTPIYL